MRACIHGAISADCAHCEEGRIEQRQQDAKDREIATPEEFARLPRRPRARGFDHNMVDGVGLALWYLDKEGLRQ